MTAVNPKDAVDLATATILIQEGMARTPQTSQQSLNDIQLTSPAENCVLESAQPNQISTTSTARNLSSDRERFMVRLFLSLILTFQTYRKLRLPLSIWRVG